MKRYAMVAITVMLMFSSAILAQDQKTIPNLKGEKKEFKKGERPMVTPEKRAEKMAKVLSLNDSQKADVKALFEKQDAKRHQEMEKVEKMRAEMKALFTADRKSNDEELSKIIGQEKFHKFQIARAERVGEMKGRMKERMKERRVMQKNHASERRTPESDGKM
jgi:protein CpxP